MAAAAALMIILLVGTAPLYAQAPAPPVTPAPAADYLLGPQDVLDVAVFGEAELSRSVTVRPDGKITFPLVGEVLVAGLTAPQLAEKLTVALKPFLKNPRVTVTVSAARPDAVRLWVYMVGQVANPGAYELKTGWTVMEAVAQAGGLTPRAALRRASLIRRSTNVTVPLDLERIVVKGDPAANVALQGGDVIMVPEFLNRVLVWGNVKNPGVFDLNEGARVLDALLAAGGPAEKAAMDAVGVIRQTADGKRVVFATVNVGKILTNADEKQNVLLQHADIVYVPASNRVTWQDILSYMSGFSLIRALFGF
jgi:polysaccharide export outer membrane protein